MIQTLNVKQGNIT